MPPKPVHEDSDDDVVPAKPVAKKPVVDDDDEDVCKPAKAKAKKPVNDDSDEEELTKKPITKKALKKKDDSDDEEITTMKPAKRGNKRQDTDSDDDGPAKNRHTDPNGDDDGPRVGSSTAVDLIDYDSMTTDLFLQHLKKQSKQQRLEEKKFVAEKAAAADASDDGDRHFDGTPAYSYKFMLDRILETCRRNNPELSKSERIKLPMPKIDRMGSKKTVLVNFKDICSALNRTEEDVKDFIEKTLTTQGSIDANHCLILRYQNPKVQTFEKLFQKYVEEFVKCSACGRIQTELEKESSSRLLVMKCKDCQASRYIQVAGSATYKAQTGKRRDRAAMV